MAQRGRVPQFGQWEDGNAAYTMIFDSARKDKNGEPIIVNPNDPEAMAAAPAKADRPPAHAPGAARAPRFIINPNDPEENPEAFRAAAAAFAQEHRQVKQGYQDRPPAPAYHHQPPRQRQGTAAAGRRPAEPAGNYGLAPASTAGPHGAPAGRKAAVPKFGGWNEMGHTPTDGYTVMFDKVKEEKHQMVHGAPTATPPRNQPQSYNHQRQHARPMPSKPESFWAKLLCCSDSSAN